MLDLLLACRVPALLVTRPHLGTLNHTALTVAVARARGLPLIGLVLNAHAPVAPGLAGERAAAELTAITGLPLLRRPDMPHLPASADVTDRWPNSAPPASPLPAGRDGIAQGERQ